MRDWREDSTRAAAPRPSAAGATLVEEQEEDRRPEEKWAQGLEPGVAGEEAGERGQSAGAEGRRGDLDADGVGRVPLAHATRRLGDQEGEYRREQETEGEEARDAGRTTPRHAHHDGGERRAGHGEAQQGGRGHVVHDEAEGEAPGEDAAPVGGRRDAGRGRAHAARLGEER